MSDACVNELCVWEPLHLWSHLMKIHHLLLEVRTQPTLDNENHEEPSHLFIPLPVHHILWTSKMLLTCAWKMSCSTQKCIIKWLSVPGAQILSTDKQNMPWSCDNVDVCWNRTCLHPKLLIIHMLVVGGFQAVIHMIRVYCFYFNFSIYHL